MMEQNEQFLQTYSFYSIYAQHRQFEIAIMLKCYNYNNTFSHLGISLRMPCLTVFYKSKWNAFNALINGCDDTGYHLMLKKVDFGKYSFQMKICNKR